MTPLDYTEADFQKITVPTLILVGDRDGVVTLEEAVEMYRLIQDAELAVAPDSDHMFFWSKPEVFTNMVMDFCLRQSATNEMAAADES